jgi:uncharacterized surface protein with fasciclin (FAS1) repeats
MKFLPTIITWFTVANSFFPVLFANAQTGDCKSIVEIAVGNDNFSTLVAALTAADLGDALSGDGPFTVFAPTNDAFAKIDENTLSDFCCLKTKLR